MKFIETKIPGVLLIEPDIHRDARGFFLESWNLDRYAAAGLPARFVQDNLSRSSRGVLRGLHYQEPFPQGKLLTVLHGEVFDVAVDIRVGSPTFGQSVGVTLSADDPRYIYIPEGCAHGFAVTSETCLFAYKCTDYYRPQCEAGLRWDDPDLGIAWPIEAPALSAKDRAAPRLRDIPADGLPAMPPAARPRRRHLPRPRLIPDSHAVPADIQEETYAC